MHEYAAGGMDLAAVGKIAHIKMLAFVERYLDVSQA